MPSVFTGLSRPSKNRPTGFVDGARDSIGVMGSSGNICNGIVREEIEEEKE